MDDRTRPGAPGPDDERVHEAMAAAIDAWHAGGPTAAEAAIAAHPDLAPVLRERLEKLQRAGMLGDPDDDGDGGAADVSSLPAMLGEFRLGKRIGGGGMGVVHVAEQLSLARTVAVKLVRPELRFFPGARARFRREVEAIARLGDPGIVPIHCVGEDHGIHFFAMEYVRGASLGDVIAAVHGRPPAGLQGRDVAVVAAARGEVPLPDALPDLFSGTWVMTCCRIVSRMARAVHHAHERGVVHRDLKPNNAMVTADGRVLLLDFGLAAAAGTSRITRSGAMLGTPHYMAPEQLTGGELDARTDVYALGVTLHELLALQPPFHAGSEHSLRQQILHGDAASLRTANSDVPRDVATIVAVARDRDPARRYPNAQALADDLERFLNHRPIDARTAGPVVRAMRWTQRHPALATGALLLAAGAALLPLAMQWSRGEAEHRARANLSGALDAVTGMLRQSRSRPMREAPGLDEERRRQVDDAARLIANLHRENPGDRVVAVAYVRGMVLVAEFRTLFGDHAGALTALSECEPTLQALAAETPDDAELATHSMGFVLSRATALVGRGLDAEADAVWSDLLARYEGRDRTTLPRTVTESLATAHNNLARTADRAGDHDAAIRHLQACLDLASDPVGREPSIDERLERCRPRINLATSLAKKGDTAAAAAAYAEIDAQLQQIAKTHPDEPDVQRDLARTQMARAAIMKGPDAGPAARELREQACAAMQKLVADFPDRATYRQELGVMLDEYAAAAYVAKDFDTAARLAAAAIDGHRHLLQIAPDNAEYASQLVQFLRQHSVIELMQGRRDEAFAEVREAIALQERVVQQRGDAGADAVAAAGLYQELALYHWRSEEWPAARDALRKARDHYEAALANGHAQVREAKRLPKLLAVLAQVESKCGDADAVVACLRRHQEVRPMAARDFGRLGSDLQVADRADFQELLRAAPGASGR